MYFCFTKKDFRSTASLELSPWELTKFPVLLSVFIVVVDGSFTFILTRPIFLDSVVTLSSLRTDSVSNVYFLCDIVFYF
jgi:hypothetical protein